MDKPIIQTYLNYRQFLSDYFLFKKENNKNFSHRSFAMKAKLSSPSHLKMVIDGKRNLSQKTIAKVANGFSFNNKTIDFFETLVLFNQSQTNDDRSNYFKKMAQLRLKRITSKTIEEKSFEFLSNWYTVALYTLIGTEGFKNNLPWLVSKLNNKVQITDIKKALNLLLSLNFIKKCEANGYIQSEGSLSVADDSKHIAVYNYHKQMNELAGEALNKLKGDVREFNGATISISKTDLPLLKEKIRIFRKEINELSSKELKGKDIYQLNVQLFPLTKLEDKT